MLRQVAGMQVLEPIGKGWGILQDGQKFPDQPDQGMFHLSRVSGTLLEPPSTKQNMTGLYLDWWHHQSSIHKIGSCEGQPALAFKMKQHVQTCGKIFRNLCLKRLM